MKNKITKNTYNYPIEKKFVKKIITRAPAHKIFKVGRGFYDLRNAIDFICDEGTPVKAALEGEVVKVVDGVRVSYNKRKPPTEKQLPSKYRDGNFVVIKHTNEEFSQYSHLKYKSILVKERQKVEAGQIIGYSGNTGWSILPHLHFIVLRFIAPNRKSFVTLKIRWKKE